ncbi:MULTISPECIES: glycoside hydrolase family 24 protein [Pseudescherichia]|uniref:glycoside hydrolase family 24 protein n=1 Tax=Pseudescherichia TaxID=2055880 RepID=UPI00301E195D
MKFNVTPQRRAFLDAIAVGEGTDNGRQQTRNHGYDVVVGGSLFSDYSRHPNRLVRLRPGLSSTAAGRYQLLSKYYDTYKQQLNLPDFGPASQDQIALQQISERRALADIDAGRIREAVSKVNNIWASLPGSKYGQRTETMDDFLKYFRAAGGKVIGE